MKERKGTLLLFTEKESDEELFNQLYLILEKPVRYNGTRHDLKHGYLWEFYRIPMGHAILIHDAVRTRWLTTSGIKALANTSERITPVFDYIAWGEDIVTMW